MRIALVAHAFPPASRTGVEVYTEALARALGRRGHEVEVFAPRPDGRSPALTQTREERDGFGLTWLSLDPAEEDEELRRARPGAAAAFGRFLERERPEVVHFQHLLGLGPELVDEARRRELPTLFTAHDYYGISDELNLIAPDLTPLTAEDLETQARCRLARGRLDRALDAHDGFLVPGRAPEALLAEVRAVLAGNSEEEERVPELVRGLRESLRARREALARVDHVEAPTRWLASALEGAGIGREVVVRPQGIELAALSGVEPPRGASDGPLRVLYVGAYHEFKGVHVLLEACAQLGDRIELHLRGLRGTSDHAAHLEQLARDAGTTLGPPFERDELPLLLEQADLLALPSLWSENAPFVLREAFAAGRPVLASETPALRESVRDGVDGRLLPAGDVEAWRAALEELAGDPAAFSQLAAGVEPPRSIDTDAAELVELYGELADRCELSRARRLRGLPEHLRPFAGRHEALTRLPHRELVARGLAGLETLARERGVELVSPAALVGELDAYQGLRERLAEAQRAIAWRRTVAADRERAVEALEARLAESEAAAEEARRRAGWLEGLVAERDGQLAWKATTIGNLEATLEALGEELAEARRGREEFEGRAAAADAHLASLEAERDALAAERDARTGEAAWLGEELRGRDAELAWTRESLEDRGAHLRELEGRIEQARAAVEEAEAERARLAQLVEARDGELLEAHATLERAAELARDDEAERGSLHETLRVLEAELAATTEAQRALGAEREAAREHEAFLEAELAERGAARNRAEARLAECEAEMRAAAEEGRGRLLRLVAGHLARRLQSWREGGR